MAKDAHTQLKTVNAHIKELNAKIRKSAEREGAEEIATGGSITLIFFDAFSGDRGSGRVSVVRSEAWFTGSFYVISVVDNGVKTRAILDADSDAEATQKAQVEFDKLRGKRG